MAAAPLPVNDERTRIRANRMRRRRFVDGTCRFVVALLAIAAALVGLDSALELSLAARCVLELIGLGIAVFLARNLLWQTWHYDGEAPIGSLARTAGFALAAAACAILAAGMPGAGDRLRRATLPWLRTTAPANYDIVVTSGDAVVHRGDPVTLVAYLRTRPGIGSLPDSVMLAIRDSDGTESRLPMRGDAAGIYHATRSAADADFDYRIEAGSVASDWHSIRIADAVELTPAARVEVIPPAYSQLPTARQAGFVDVEAWQWSRANFHLEFNRPAESAFLEWRADGASTTELAEAIPIRMADDRRSADAAMTLQASGTLRLILVNESGPRKLRTESAISVRARRDAPPRFERIAGIAPKSCRVRPDHKLTVAVAVVDDLGVAEAELEYALGANAAPERIPLPLTGAGTQRATGAVTLDLRNKVSDETVVRYRLRVRDNRSIDGMVGPQETLYPANGWAELQVASDAPPYDPQEIFGLRDSLRVRFDELARESADALFSVQQLRQDTAGRSPLPLDHGYRINAIRERMRKSQSRIEAAAKEIALTVELRPLAFQLRAIAAGPFAEADDALRVAATDDAAERAAQLELAAARLRDAGSRLKELMTRNARLAQERLDARRIAALAADQEALAVSPAPPEQVLKLQKQLLERLRNLVAESEPLRRARQAAIDRRAAEWAAEVRAIADDLRELDGAIGRSHAALRESLLTDLAAAQLRFAQRASDTFAALATPLRLSGMPLPAAEEFVHAAALLRQDRMLEALTELERLAEALDRQADEFGRLADERGDAKQAARQLAKWQDDLRIRFARAVKSVPFEKLPAERRAAFAAEQQALLRVAEGLTFPSDRPSAERRANMLASLMDAAKELAGDGVSGDEAMKSAAAALALIEDKTPTAADRLARSRPEIDSLHREQDAIVAAAEPILRTLDKPLPSAALFQTAKAKLASLQGRQAKLAERLAGVDLPGLASRQKRLLRAARAAAADLDEGIPRDAAASLAWSKRELDRLRHALDRQPPVDERLDELARKQRAIARSLLVVATEDKIPAPQREAVLALETEVAGELAMVLPREVSEATGLYKEGLESVQAAAAGLRLGSDRETTVLRLFAAADALLLLADRVNDRESARDRLQRLAANRQQGVCFAKQLAGRPMNLAASRKVANELGREAEELLHTRVGGDGQRARRNILDLYAKLQARPEPDRHGSDHKHLAEALEQLAATLNRAELASKPAAHPAENILPSEVHAALLRELARSEREVRERCNALPAELLRLGKPDADTGAAAARQFARLANLSKEAGALARRLDEAKRDADEREAKPLGESAALVRQAGIRLSDAAKKLAAGSPMESAQARAEAHLQLLKAAEGKGKTPVEGITGRAVYDGERVMRAAIRELEAGNRPAATAAQRRAASALRGN
ncbi:MAG TPA: hypothetical protein VN641_17740 [Urbifossiella sp.]|nr:hypothetical protein [Urbifossiella sp.]